MGSILTLQERLLSVLACRVSDVTSFLVPFVLLCSCATTRSNVSTKDSEVLRFACTISLYSFAPYGFRVFLCLALSVSWTWKKSFDDRFKWNLCPTATMSPITDRHVNWPLHSLWSDTFWKAVLTAKYCVVFITSSFHRNYGSLF